MMCADTFKHMRDDPWLHTALGQEGRGDLLGPGRMVDAWRGPLGVCAPVVEVGGEPDHVMVEREARAYLLNQKQDPPRMVDAPQAAIFLGQAGYLRPIK